MNCTKCHAENLDTANVCTACGAQIWFVGLPVGSRLSVKASIARTLGILSLVLFCLPPGLGVLAVILGVWARLDVRRSSGRLRGSGVALAAIALGIVGTAVQSFIWTSGPFEPAIRAKGARVQSEFRSLATALEAYVVDEHTYPSMLRQLTTPVAYITALPQDVYAPSPGQGRSKPLFLYALLRVVGPANDGWVLASCGPDGKYDLVPLRDLPPGTALTPVEIGKRLTLLTFDPTNGTKSRGDIFKVGGGAMFDPHDQKPGRPLSGIVGESEGKP
jgi:hypothetical protein